MRFFCLGALLGLACLVAEARPSGQQLSECRDEYELLAALEVAIDELNDRRAVFESLYNDDAPASAALDDVLKAGSGSAQRDWPQTIDCPALDAQYASALADYKRAQSRLQRQQSSWSALSAAMRDGLLRVWQSRQRLLLSAAALQASLEQQDGVDPLVRQQLQGAIEQSRSELSVLRRELFEMMPALQREAMPSGLRELLLLWHQAYEVRPVRHLPDATLLSALPGPLAQDVRDYFRLAQLDVLVQRNALSYVRGWLWESQPALFERAGDTATDGLLLDEIRAFQTRLEWLVADTQASYRHAAGESGPPGWLKLFEYGLGLLGLVALVYLARSLKAPVVVAQGRFARWSQGRRLAGPISRATAGLPLLTPWLVGLLGLGLLHLLFTRLHLPLLATFLPLARLFILYGLISLAGEWLLQRTAQQAGSYLNDEQLAQAQRQARLVAAVAVLPLLVRDFVELGVGPSRLLDLCHWASLLGILLALGLLLRSRREDFIEALKSFLPSQGDRLIERLLDKRLFLLVAPIAAPPLLLALVLNFLHKALFDYDWYRRLFARSFKLRVAAVEAEQGELDGSSADSRALEAYQRWFLSDDHVQLPFIDSGLYVQVRKSLDPWLDDRGSDNALLLTGANGAGKSSVLQRLTRDLDAEHPQLRLVRLRIEDKLIDAGQLHQVLGEVLGADLSDGPAALVRADAELSPSLVIIDDAQNLFLRRVGGLAAWEALLALANARVENLFWLVLINNHSWAYLSNVYGRDYQFRNIKVARRWSQPDVRSLVLSRNHLSGCRIRYDNILLATRGPEAGSIRNAEQLYFSLLWDACQGNPKLALHLWLRSIRLSGNTVVVGLPEEVGSSSLEQLDSALHFVYAAVMIHENMTTDELIATTALSEGVVRRALKTGMDLGFLERSSSRRYRVATLWYPTIVRLLARKNLLHE
ncbi:ATP-binding protein [Halopseudomonas maritima]|uniref:ATP-binding protein n=1 Tax=Halopseudomonas maritima TaxID=2918528 RepID=UPI001EE9D60E|nr:ATP-binding protein [Halopseudomonas maritima]UJJ32525.1 ATP-binding protein [Halopseudomonas maritima]